VHVNSANPEKGNISCMNLQLSNQDYLQLNYQKPVEFIFGKIHFNNMQPRRLHLAKNWFICSSYVYLCMSETWSRGFINVLSRRATGFHTWAKLLYIRTELLCKKNFLLDGQTSQAKSSSQPVNLPGVRPLMKPLMISQRIFNDQFCQVWCPLS